MKLLEMIRTLREDYLDDVSDNPDQDDSEYLWSRSFLHRALAKAEDEACRRSDLIFDKDTAAVCNITLADGTDAYSVHAKVTRIERVIYDDNPLEHKSEAELTHEDAQWQTRTGTPTAYVVRGRKIVLTPIPDSDDDGETLYLEVFRRPLYSFVDEPEIGEEWHESLLLYGAYRAYRRRDEDTYNPQAAKEYLMDFDDVFGKPITSLVREHQMRSPASLQFTMGSIYSDAQ